MTLAMVHKPDCDEPDVIALCQCEANVQCRTCGWGRGAIPCKCSNAVMLGYVDRPFPTRPFPTSSTASVSRRR